MIVLLGEVGGIEEYDVCAALKDGRITKPLVAWCIGTCASEYDLTNKRNRCHIKYKVTRYRHFECVSDLKTVSQM